MNTAWKIYWVAVSVTVVNYLIMILWSLPLIAEMAGGAKPFDMRPAGYSFNDAQVFMEAISDSGRAFYLNTQHLLDFFYPTLFAIVVGIPLLHLTPRYLGWPLTTIAIAAAIFDHLENSAVAVMLTAGPGKLTESLVSTASFWTLAKSISTTIASLALLTLLCIKGVKWFKTRKSKAG
jgi:hypothetical protein